MGIASPLLIFAPRMTKKSPVLILAWKHLSVSLFGFPCCEFRVSYLVTRIVISRYPVLNGKPGLRPGTTELVLTLRTTHATSWPPSRRMRNTWQVHTAYFREVSWNISLNPKCTHPTPHPGGGIPHWHLWCKSPFFRACGGLFTPFITLKTPVFDVFRVCTNFL